MKKTRHNHSIFWLFLIPVLVIMVVQGMISFGTLVASNTSAILDDYSIGMMTRTVNNRSIILENDMIERWSAIGEKEELMTEKLSTYLEASNMDIATFLAEDSAQQAFLESIFPTFVSLLRNDTTTGLFFILANDADISKAAQYQGFFLRDSDPSASPVNDTDLLLERGTKKLAREMHIPLDAAWTTSFSLQGSDVRNADDFFYTPYQAALDHTDTKMRNLGYWSKPFILEDSSMDSHDMITYSIPLIYDGEIYGVMGAEISVSYLKDYFPVKEIEVSLEAGYMLALDQGDGTYIPVTGKGAIYDTVARSGSIFAMEKRHQTDFYQVKGINIGKQSVYGIVCPLKLYSSNVPYENTDWVLIGLNTEENLFGMGQQIYIKMIIAILVGLLFGIVGVYFLVRFLTEPVMRLMKSVQGGLAGIHSFKHTAVREVNDLHEVVQNLTDHQQHIEEQLIEDTERYRIALESSENIFYTYHFQGQTLDMFNDPEYSGSWYVEDDCFWSQMNIYPSDRSKIKRFIQNMQDEMRMEFRVIPKCDSTYKWFLLTGKVICDASGMRTKIVGSIQNIDEQKQREIAEKLRKIIDPGTGFFKQEAAMMRIDELRQKQPDGYMVVFDIDDFTRINEKFGLIFGDVLLAELAGILKHMPVLNLDEVVAGRIGGDELMLWLPGYERERTIQLITQIRKEFEQIIYSGTLMLRLSVGAACGRSTVSEETLLGQSWDALSYVGSQPADSIFYDQLPEKIRQNPMTFAPSAIVSTGYAEQMNLVSLTLNLFDKDGDFSALMDLLALQVERSYHISHLYIAVINRDYHSLSIDYEWHHDRTFHLKRQAGRYTESDYEHFLRWHSVDSIQAIQPFCSESPMFDFFLDNTEGVVVHMADGGAYMGSLFLVGMMNTALDSDDTGKELKEIGTIIQTRMNQERHDLSSKAKSEFLSRMSHEIRTPMNGIIGMTEIALKEGQDDERRIDCLNKIKYSSDYLLGLINDILDMSKIESGKMQLSLDDFNLSEMLEGLQELLSANISSKEICFEKDFHLTHHCFHGDELRLNQVLINLIGNAVKFTEAGGKVCLTVRESEIQGNYSDIYFAVSDNGIGITKENQERVFKTFEQAHANSSVRPEGTGLGLTISNRLIQLMGSEIYLDSEEGKGSTFSFTIRLMHIKETERQAQTMKKTVRFDGMKVLVVEDNELNMEIICTILGDYGIVTDGAWDGQQAVERIAESAPNTYNLILMDIMMPVMDGLEATKCIRQLDRPDCQTLPIVAMSANTFDEDIKKSLASGMNAHLGKPIDIDKLEKMLVQYMPFLQTD